MMNANNEISNQTKLYGFIGEHAGVSRFSTTINKLFKSEGDDAMMIPMNIREDDLYFTVSNMRNSHVNGAVISNEYVTLIPEIMDEVSGLVKMSGMCDLVFRKDDKLYGELYSMRVLLEKLKDYQCRRVALIGVGPHAKAFSYMACGFEISYYYDNLEELMGFCDEQELHEPDVNRIAAGMEVDFGMYDAVLDFSDFESLEMVSKLPAFSWDMKNAKEFSALKTRAHQLGTHYIGYDDMIDDLSKQVYNLVKR
jgi:hypothetical protein